MKMILGVTFPLVAYTISSVMIAINSGSKKGIHNFFYNCCSVLAALAFLGQLVSVFSFGIVRSLRNFLIIILIAAIPGLITYWACISVRKKQMLRHSLFAQVLQLAQNPLITEIQCSGKEILFIAAKPGTMAYPQRVAVPNGFYANIFYDQSGYQGSPSKELKWFAKLLAGRLGGCKVFHDLKTKKISWGSGGYTVRISGNSGTVSPNTSFITVVEREVYHIQKKTR